MLLAERGGPHTSAVFEYSSGWVSTGVPHFVGVGSGKNSGGGIDYGYKEKNNIPTALCDAFVLATGNCMAAQAISGASPNCDIYGIEFIASTGNLMSPSNSITDFFIDFNHSYGSDQKYQVGDVEQFKCGCPPSSSICDSITVTSSVSPVQTDSCCFVLNVQNQKPNFFSGIQLCANNGVSISAVSALNGWSIAGYSSQFISVIPPGPPGSLAPVGNLDFVKFCLSNYQNIPVQEILVKYFGPNETLVCVDTLLYECSQTPKCLKLTDTVECADNGQYKMSFCIMSDALIGWNVNSIKLNPPAGITFTPSVFSVNNLLPGQMQCGFMTFISGALDGQTIYYSVTAHKENILSIPPINPTECCTDTLMLGCITMPDCICNNVSASAQPVQQMGDTCCWKVTLTNNYSNTFFTGVDLNIITPGVVFGAVINPFGSGWSSTSSSTQILFQPKPAGSFIGASSMLPTFCLSGIDSLSQVPQEIELSWLGPDGKTVCKDTLRLDCPPPVNTQCAELVNWKIDCDLNNPGAYIFSFQVKNNSSFSINQINLNAIAPPAIVLINQFTIPLLAPGQTSGTLSTSILGLTAGQSLCFNLTVHEISAGTELNCCTNSQQYCLPMPPCPSNSCCTDSLTFFNTAINVQTNGTLGNCMLHFEATGLDSCMQISYSWGDGPTVLEGPYGNNTAVWHTYTNTGTYTVCQYIEQVDHDGTLCWSYEKCEDVFVICDCCTDFDLFCQHVENATSITVNNDSCKVKVIFDNLPDCDYIEYIDWGVNPSQQTQGPFNAGDMAMFVYPGSGTYFISYLAIELDAAGNICFEKIVRDTITVECNTCCTDFDLFCQNVENAISTSVNNDSCKVKVNFGNLPDCDYIEYIDWGVNPSQQTQGPFKRRRYVHVCVSRKRYLFYFLSGH